MKHCDTGYFALLAWLAITWPDLSGQSLVALTSDISNEYDPFWSPRGDSLSFTSDRSGHQHIYSMAVTGGRPNQLTSGSFEDIHSSWLPDGGGIAFSSNRSGNQDMWLFSLPGFTLTNLTNSPANEESIDYSRNGQFFCFNSNRSAGNWDIWKQLTGSGTLTRLTSHPANDGEPSVSPDGSRIAFISGRNNHIDIWVMNSDGTGARALTNDLSLDLMPCWHPSGDSITFASNRNGNFDLFSISVEDQHLCQLTSSTADEVYPSWSPDGRCLAYSANYRGNEDIYLLLVPEESLVYKIPCGQPVTVDGVMEKGEWDDGLLLQIQAPGRQIPLRVKHDGLALLIGIDLKNNSSGIIRFPELLIDTHHDRSSTWQPDDWWFHVSATDCYSQGAYSDYSQCETDHPGWDAVPNFGTSASDPPIDSIEIRIPLETLDINLADTIGMAFDVTNTFNAWELWPPEARLDQSATWAAFCFEQPSGLTLSPGLSPGLTVFPNPAHEILHVEGSLKYPGNYLLTIRNSTGSTVAERTGVSGYDGKIRESFNLSGSSAGSGWYVLVLSVPGEPVRSVAFFILS